MILWERGNTVDSFLVKGLAFDIEAVKNPLKNKQQKWSGEKMIILPSLIHDDCDRDLIITKFSKLKHSKFGIVAIAEMAQEDIKEDTSLIETVISLIKQSLGRDEGWKE